MLRDPLVHFLAVGACLFAVFLWRGGEEPPDRIVVPRDAVERVMQTARLLEGREPTAAEVEVLIEPVVREEVLYREALALGLDENDDEVRRRLVEKMQYLTEDIADPEPPSDAALRAFYDAAPERFEVPERVTFDQVFFSPSQRGDALEDDVAEGLARLRAGAAPAEAGDRTPLEGRLADAERDRVRILFGEAMTDAIFSAPPGQWIGPYRSDFGLHLVRLVAKSDVRQPAFEEIEDEVRQVFADTRRQQANEAAYAEMRARYEVEIDWPEVDADADTGGVGSAEPAGSVAP